MLLAGQGLRAQELIPPGTDEERLAIDSFSRLWPLPSGLSCSITTFPARLGYALRFWAGYEVTLPVPVSGPREGSLAIALRVTPTGSATRYFAARLDYADLPEDPKQRRRLQLYTSGGLAFGVGQYQADLLVIDSGDRTCRKSWRVTAKETNAQERIAPNVVEENRFERWPGMPAKAGSAQVTVFLHVAPLWRRRSAVRLSPWERGILLGSLVSLLDTSRYSRARVIAYNLDARAVLLETEDFGPRDYRRLLRAIDGLNLGQVDAATLAVSPVTTLGLMIEREAKRTPSDAIVYLGPLSRYDGKPNEPLREISRQLQPAFGFQLWPAPGFTGDIVTRFLELGGGRSVRIYSPGDLAKAIRTADGN